MENTNLDEDRLTWVYVENGGVIKVEMVYACRKLTAQQKALILSYAETETGVDGTVNGIASTNDGMILPMIIAELELSDSMLAVASVPSCCHLATGLIWTNSHLQ